MKYDKEEELTIKKSKKRLKWFTVLLVGGLLLLGITVGVLTYWTFQNDDVLTIKNEPFPARFIDFKGDKAVILTVDFCKNIEVNGKVRISFVAPSKESFLPVSDEKSPKGCEKRDLPILLPNDLVPDTYTVKFRATYKLNPIKQEVVNEFQSISFKVE